MPTNEFLPVAIDGVPNVQPQGDYAGSEQQQQGWANGEVPSSAQWNKMMRQAAFIASSVAQFVCNALGVDVLDDGDQASFITKLTSALAYAPAATRTITTGGTSTLLSTDVNVIINQAVAAAKTVELPADPPDNYSVTVWDGKGDADAHNITVDGNGHTINGLAAVPINQPYQSVVFLWDKTGEQFLQRGA